MQRINQVADRKMPEIVQTNLRQSGQLGLGLEDYVEKARIEGCIVRGGKQILRISFTLVQVLVQRFHVNLILHLQNAIDAFESAALSTK